MRPQSALCLGGVASETGPRISLPDHLIFPDDWQERGETWLAVVTLPCPQRRNRKELHVLQENGDSDSNTGAMLWPEQKHRDWAFQHQQPPGGGGLFSPALPEGDGLNLSFQGHINNRCHHTGPQSQRACSPHPVVHLLHRKIEGGAQVLIKDLLGTKTRKAIQTSSNASCPYCPSDVTNCPETRRRKTAVRWPLVSWLMVSQFCWSRLVLLSRWVNLAEPLTCVRPQLGQLAGTSLVCVTW